MNDKEFLLQLFCIVGISTDQEELVERFIHTICVEEAVGLLKDPRNTEQLQKSFSTFQRTQGEVIFEDPNSLLKPRSPRSSKEAFDKVVIAYLKTIQRQLSEDQKREVNRLCRIQNISVEV